MKEKIIVFISVVAAAGLFFIAGCSRPAAVVNGKKIDRAIFDLYMKEKIQDHMLRNVTPDAEKLKEAVIQELIAERLIIDEAGARGITVSEEELNSEIEAMKKSAGAEAFDKALKGKGISDEVFRKRTREKMIMLRFIKSLAKEDDVTGEEISEYYKNSPKPFIKTGRVLMKMIEFSTEQAAKETIEKMKNGKISFDDMAKKLSEENKAIVSNYGWVNPAFFSPSISEALKDMKPGDSGGPYKGLKNYFLIKVKDREKESIAKFDEVKNDIKAMLLEQKRQAELAHWLANKKKTAKIEINI
ncbi:MAG: SurA N-terminal domain-containing protein [Nitrospirota bacterium]